MTQAISGSSRVPALAAAVIAVCTAGPVLAQAQISLSTYQDKVRGAWIGEMAGVAWGNTTEYGYTTMMPDAAVPAWNAGDVNNGFVQDDIYVEIPFMDTMKVKGVNCSWTDFGNTFKNTSFPLWHANMIGRNNLQAGKQAPWSGHYSNNSHADDIDWQIEANFAGMIAPGQVSAAKEVAWRAGHVMNYGDGVYGGVTIAAMHAKAYVASNVREVVEAGRSAIPRGSAYRNVIDDLIAWKDAGKTWDQNWQLVTSKYRAGARCPTIQSDNPYNADRSIDAKLNGAYVFMGLLYGNGDLEQSMKIAMRCGQDSDCNPSSVGSVIGGLLGATNIPDKFKIAISTTNKFSNANYTFDAAVTLTTDLARQVMLMRGGRITGSGATETWTLGQDADRDLILEKWPATTNAAPSIGQAIVALQQGGQVAFTGSATDGDGIAGYQWFFGDVSYSDVGTSSALTANHVYTAIGTYEAICYVTDGVGNTSWQSVPVNVVSVPEPGIGATIGLAVASLLIRRRPRRH